MDANPMDKNFSLQRDEGNGSSAGHTWQGDGVEQSDVTRSGINFVHSNGVRTFANDDQELTRRIDLEKSGITYLSYITRSKGAGCGIDAVFGNGAGAVVADVEKLSRRKQGEAGGHGLGRIRSSLKAGEDAGGGIEIDCVDRLGIGERGIQNGFVGIQNDMLRPGILPNGQRRT